MQPAVDVVGWAGVLSEREEVTGLHFRPFQRRRAADAAGRGASEPRQDWGEAPDVFEFVGRTAELSSLRTWVLDAGCRFVAATRCSGVVENATGANRGVEDGPQVLSG